MLFTTRYGGVSEGPYASLNLGERTGDDPSAVATNLARLRGRIAVPIARCAQVHGRDVVRLTDLPDGARPKADGIATNVAASPRSFSPPTACPSRSARPAPSRWSTPAGAAWPAASLEEGVAALRDLGATGPVSAAIGPGAGGCCYEVGDEVRAAFADVPEAPRPHAWTCQAVARAKLSPPASPRSRTPASAPSATSASSPTAGTAAPPAAREASRG